MSVSGNRSDHDRHTVKGRAVVVLVVVAGLVVAAVLTAPLILHMQLVRDALLSEFEQRTGHRLAMEDLEVHLFPRPRLTLLRVKIFETSSEAPLLSADRLDMAFQIWPLLEGRAVAAYVVVERPRTTLRHHQSGQWTIGGGTPDSTSEKTGRPLGFLALVRNALIVDGAITILDESRPAHPAPLRLASLQVTMTEEIPGRTVKVQLSGEMPQGAAGSALLNIDGSLVLLNGADAGEPSDAAMPVQAEGTIRLHKLDVRHIAGWLGLPRGPAEFVPPAQLVGRLRLVPGPSGYDLIVAEWRAGLSDFSLQGTATLTGLGTELPHMSATLFASSMPLKHTLDQLPAEWLPADIREKLAEHAVDGLVSLHDTHVDGTFGEPASLNVAGVVEIRDGRFLPGETHPVVRELSATVLYDLEQIRVTGLRGNYGPVRLSDGTVLITEWKREPMVDLRISGVVRAEDMVALLNDRGRFPQIDASLSQLEQVTGEIGMVAHWAGQPGKGDLDLEEASVTIRNLGFRHTGLAVPFRQIHANVNVSATEIRLHSLQGQVGPAQVEAAGKLTLAGKLAFQGVTLKLTADGRDIVPWLHPVGPEGTKPDVEGPIHLRAAVMGSIKTPRFNGTLTLDGAAVDIPHLFAKTKGAPAGIGFDGELTDNLILSVRRSELVIPPVRLTGQGRIHLAGEMDFQASIVSDALSLDKLPPGVTLGPIRAGILKAGLRMSGRAADRASWVTSGRLHFGKGLIQVEGLQEPIRNLTLGLRFDGKNIDIRRLTFNIGDSDIRLSGAISDWIDAPQAKLVVESKQIDVRSLRLTGETGSSSTKAFPILTSWWAKGSIDVMLLIDYVYYERILITGLSCGVRFKHGTLTIDRISGDTSEGHLGGRFVMNMPERGPRSMRTSFRVSGLPVERLLSLVDKQLRISGWLTTAGKIQAEFQQGHLLRSSVESRRPISILIEDGRIFKAPVISKLLAVLNLPALLKGEVDLTQGGMPLDRLKLVLGVNKGIIMIDEFLMDSPILKISGTGRYDFIDNQFDAVVVASPLGQYSDLLKSVPLFGKLFAGERQGFDTAIFEVKGPAEDPDLRYLSAESLMTGAKGTAKLALDLLVNAITLPIEAYSMTKDLFVDDGDGEEE